MKVLTTIKQAKLLNCGTSLVAQTVKASAYNVGDLGSIPRLGRSPGEGNGNPLQCYCLENPRDGGAWWAAVYELPQNQTQLKLLSSSSSVYYLIPEGNLKCLTHSWY